MDPESGDEGDFCLTPPALKQLAGATLVDEIPTKSKAVYERNYQKFLAWCKEQNVPEDYVSENVVMAYLKHLHDSKRDGSLWNIFSTLKTTIRVYNKVSFNCERIVTVIKHWTKSYKTKKSAAFAMTDVEKFLDTAPDNEFLWMKLILLLALFGAMRRSELHALTMADISRFNDHLIVKIQDSKTGPRSFMAVEHVIPARNILTYYDAYLKIRPKTATLPTDKLFWTVRNGKCINQHIGINKIGDVPGIIAEFLKLPNAAEFTGHAFRRSSATFLADAGIDMINLKRAGGWKSDQVAEGYIAESNASKRKIADLLFGDQDPQHEAPKVPRVADIQPNMPVNLPVLPALNIGYAWNCTFNVTSK